MTKRSWLHRVRAATRAARRADEFRQRPGSKRLRVRALGSHKMYRGTGDICTRALLAPVTTLARQNVKALGGDNRCAVLTSSHARFALAGKCATLDQRARRARRRVLLDAPRRARAATPASARLERRTPRRRGSGHARPETSRTGSTRLPALRLVARGLAPRHVSTLPVGARCP